VNVLAPDRPAGRLTRIGNLFRNRFFIVVSIFLLAFSIRCSYNAGLEHRVWFLEDSQNYLRSGASIIRMVSQSRSPQELLKNISADASSYSGMYIAFNSDKLVDRLVTDGPIFPLYLSAVLPLTGYEEQKSFQWERIIFKVSIANSAVDASTCILLCLAGFLLFGTLPGAIAGLLYAIYPAAIVNTHWCMCENFVTFMLTASVCSLARLLMLPANAIVNRIVSGITTGVILGLTVLARSAFPFVLPFLAVASFVGMRRSKADAEPGTRKAAIVSVVSIAIAFAAIASPWLLYTKTALGQARLTTNRLPAFNLLSGNLTTTDGWTPYPSTIPFPEDMRVAASMVVENAKAHPVDWLLLQTKKLSRLWSAPWNDCKYPTLGLPPAAQNVLHQLMIFLGASWAFIACARGRRALSKGEWLGTSLIIATVSAHFVYMAFIALSRYAMSAMPLIILAAGASLSFWLGQERRKRNRFFLIVATFCLLCPIINELRVWSAVPTGMISQGWWLTIAPWLVAMAAICAYGAVWLALTKHTSATVSTLRAAKGETEGATVAAPPNQKPAPALVIASIVSFAAVACSLAGSIVTSHLWSEWTANISDRQAACQTIKLPKTTGILGPTAYVAMDIHTPDSLPQLNIEVNGTRIGTQALPIPMLQKDSESIVQSIAVQAKVMDQDYRSIRHWYIAPFPSRLLKPGQENTIRISSAHDTSVITVYGDYAMPSSGEMDGETILPSINSTCWNYAVEGADYRLPIEQRPLETISIKGLTSKSFVENGKAPWGKLRIRLLVQPLNANKAAKLAASEAESLKAVPAATKVASDSANTAKQSKDVTTGSTEKNDSKLVIFEQKAGEERTVHGGDPNTFYFTETEVPVSEQLLAKHPLKFTCELKTEKRPVVAYPNLVFKTGNGDVWNPTWQPYSVPVDASGWTKITVVDSFPKNLLEHGGVTARPVLTPFTDDLLFNNQKKASKQTVKVRNAKLEFMNTEIPQREDFFTWTVY
jgi:4-amino-4-deoxy-L-arabinose transferase-like glycosyltransferase